MSQVTTNIDVKDVTVEKITGHIFADGEAGLRIYLTNGNGEKEIYSMSIYNTRFVTQRCDECKQIHDIEKMGQGICDDCVRRRCEIANKS